MTMAEAGYPPRQGLYDPALEHDSCGFGFVADIKGRPSHDIVVKALEVLLNLEHRGATGAEKDTGDGAGILLQTPHAFLATECEKLGLAFIPYFPLASGLLSGKYTSGGSAPPQGRLSQPSRFRERFLNDRNVRTVKKLEEFARRRGHTLLELAFCWLLAHKVVASVIAGSTKPEQVYANANAVDWKLTNDELAEVDRIAGHEDDLARAG